MQKKNSSMPQNVNMISDLSLFAEHKVTGCGSLSYTTYDKY